MAIYQTLKRSPWLSQWLQEERGGKGAGNNLGIDAVCRAWRLGGSGRERRELRQRQGGFSGTLFASS